MNDPDTLRRAVADAALAMQNERGSQETMQVAADAARHLVAGCQIAAVSVLTRSAFESVITSTDPDAAIFLPGGATGAHEAVQEIDTLQHELEEGPCHEAMRRDATIHCEDLAVDTRWTRWSPVALERLAVRSVVSHPLSVGAKVLGALKVYGAEPSAFTLDDVDLLGTFAVHISVALAASRDLEHLHDALDSRTLIGQATGLIMARYDLSADAAFAALARTSQETNTKVRDLADQLVRTGRFPAEGQARRSTG
ncbi:GAF and ANTAR domain-containing protein [Nocardioides zeae]|uniref:GAF and ANTAR domain-containing protein n=1 Tax=Nocardioides imazamoxiresistens TaxID=3231893 RepID=A0ABU3Q0G8_9ACTN|nr:GAF and ANTAR domain-containing protein [Nocardioides zeae]MDT9594969.1 GAF and ANTAR domain-containing protein [Nocardioides zeae]